jgi:hypothetical protein
VNVNSPILGMSSDLTKKDRMSAALFVELPGIEPVSKRPVSCGKLNLTTRNSAKAPRNYLRIRERC